MEIDIQVYNLINLLLKVLLYSLIASMPLVILTTEMYLYETYKKWKDTAKKDKEKIILGKANKIVSLDSELERQEQGIKKRKLEIELLDVEIKVKKDSLGKADLEEAEEDFKIEIADYENMNIKQLRQIAKDKKMTMYSRLSKEDLIKKLS